MWCEDRIEELLSTEDADVMFLSGCASNQGRFYAQFDHIILLTTPARMMVERLTTRTTNSYGKHPDELAQALRYKETIEPELRRGASAEVDTSAPVDQVTATILRLVRG
ncbi:MAG: ATP-binding protein [Thermoleophilaceae bacterium]|nr:ATP-binding protein [Thermoleophilaceae bacterium]